MSHYAHITNGKVDNVLVITYDVLLSGLWGDPNEWVKTSYNTIHGIHGMGKTPLRKNFAQIGYTYDKVKDMFIPEKQYPSWILNDEIGDYEPPIKMPTDNKPYIWNETTLNWKDISEN